MYRVAARRAGIDAVQNPHQAPSAFAVGGLREQRLLYGLGVRHLRNQNSPFLERVAASVYLSQAPDGRIGEGHCIRSRLFKGYMACGIILVEVVAEGICMYESRDGCGNHVLLPQFAGANRQEAGYGLGQGVEVGDA